MRRLLFFLAFFFWALCAKADVVKSCDGIFVARISKPGILIVEQNDKKVWVEKINHDLTGGVFDLNNSMLIVYGVPIKIDVAHPQAMRLSVYAIKSHPREIMSRTYGGGIYEVVFGEDNNSVLVNSRFGYDVINIEAKKVESFDLLSEPTFTRQECTRK